MYQTILTEVDAGVGIITLNCAERHNAFDDVLIGELTQAIAAMTQDAAVRVIVLSSSGKSFCAGADLNWMRRAANYSDAENLRDARALAEMLRCLAQCPKPTIARVQGPAYAGGVGLVACCDIAIAVFDAQFSLPEVRIGIVPATISPYVISAIGKRHAHRYMLTAERFSAAVAYRIGLVHELVADEAALDNAIGEIVEDLLKNAPDASAECKSLITAVANKPLTPDIIEDTAQRITRLRASTEGREGMRAFLEKRKPHWAANETF
ncbi:enoyl-CoA hydratase [Rugosibacter aromaticivorans]|uniref:Enoyl-CoA hydratase n=1 Tax=Rugosibacter aromaticivorans TaxID=1565605 RepID=A0A0C5JJH7_9PROT|nr:enoyl-CoA hydratase/isomerase family protein [Rugosibacter aromaticivorans]AJP47476.1 enoyl-CoA hydratase [Rugosibacter aromaticivorans]TBR13047.1 MAG: enoyl-CoA hydratase/isomerase family protein [Rugosibacter sp.]